MTITHSRNGVPIRLSQERWGHIRRRHPELDNQKEKIVETLSDPDCILAGDFGELLAVRLYPETPLTRKYLNACPTKVAAASYTAKSGIMKRSSFTSPIKLAMRTTVWRR